MRPLGAHSTKSLKIWGCKRWYPKDLRVCAPAATLLTQSLVVILLQLYLFTWLFVIKKNQPQDFIAVLWAELRKSVKRRKKIKLSRYLKKVNTVQNRILTSLQHFKLPYGIPVRHHANYWEEEICCSLFVHTTLHWSKIYSFDLDPCVTIICPKYWFEV